MHNTEGNLNWQNMWIWMALFTIYTHRNGNHGDYTSSGLAYRSLRNVATWG